MTEKNNDKIFEPKSELLGSEMTNIHTIAQLVFGYPPRPPNTIHLMLDDVEDLNRVLSIFVIEGIRHKYGEDINPSIMTEAQLLETKVYMNSIGYNIDMTTEKKGDYDIHKITFKKYDSTQNYTNELNSKKGL